MTAYSPTEADLTWTNASRDADGYSILRSDDGGTTFQNVAFVAGTAESYSDTGLTPGTTYSYMVQATGATTAAASPGPTSAPTALPMASDQSDGTDTPTLSVAPDPKSPTSAVLTWDYGDTNDTGFELEMCDEGAGTNYQLIATPGPVTFDPNSVLGSLLGTGTTTVGGLVPGDTYDFRIRADHAGGTASRYAPPVTIGLGLPAAPSVVATLWYQDAGTFGMWPHDQLGWRGVPAGDGVQIQVRGDAYAGPGWHDLDNDQGGDDWPADVSGPAADGSEGEVYDPGLTILTGTYEYRVRGTGPGGTVTAWSNPASVSLGSVGGPGPALSLSSTDTTVTVTWAGSALVMQQEGVTPYSTDEAYAHSYAPTGLPDPATNTYSVTYTDLTPGTYYDFVALYGAGTPYDADPGATQSYVLFATIGRGGIRTTGVAQPAPAAPTDLHAVNLGDGISKAKVELIWQNTADNEDGYVIQRSTAPDFTRDAAQMRVGADVTAYVDTSSYPQSFIQSSPNYGTGTTYYYRVAAYRGNLLSDWASISDKPSHSPVAMAISWFPTVPYNDINSPERAELAAVPNSPPPVQFFEEGNGPEVYSLSAWEALKDYRNILTLQVGYDTDPYTGKLVGVDPRPEQVGGYTPLPALGMGPLHLAGGAEMDTTGLTWNAGHTAVTVVARAKFRLNKVEMFFFGLTRELTHLDFHGAAWVWAQITYTIHADGSTEISFGGSTVPSQTDYLDQKADGQGYDLTQHLSDLDSFLDARYGESGPPDGREGSN